MFLVFFRFKGSFGTKKYVGYKQDEQLIPKVPSPTCNAHSKA